MPVDVRNSLLLDVLAILVVGFIAARQFREKRMKVNFLWVMPALTLLFTYTGIQQDLFDTAFSPQVIGAAFVIGLAVGAVRGATTKLVVDTPSQSIIVKGTYLSVTLWLILLAAKGVADFAFAAANSAQSVAGLTAALITAALLAFSLGAIIATRVYFYWRYAFAAT